MSFYLGAFIPAPGAAGQVLTSTGTAWSSAAAPSGGPTWTTKTANYNAAAGDYLNCNTSAGAFTVTLAAAPATNSTVYFQDAAGTFDLNNLTVNPNGKTIMGDSGNLVCTQRNAGFGLIYNGSDWRVF